MAWVLRPISIGAAAITSLFVARDALNFGVAETMVTITLVVVLGVAFAGWDVMRKS